MHTLRMRAARIQALALLVVVMYAPVPAAHAAGVYRPFEVDGLRIVFDSEWITQAAPGYIPIRIDITNTTRPRTIEIVDRGNRHVYPGFAGLARAPRVGGLQSGTLSLVQRVTLARGSRVYLTIPIPVSAQTGEGLAEWYGWLRELLLEVGAHGAHP